MSFLIKSHNYFYLFLFFRVIHRLFLSVVNKRRKIGKKTKNAINVTVELKTLKAPF